MQLSVRINDGNTTPAARRNLIESVDHALSKFANHLRRVSLSVTDINGPRGGKDKHCRLVLHMNRMQPIVIEDLDFSVGGVIHQSIERAVYTVSQRISRLNQSRHRG
jgi:hypothetical protein